MSQRSLTPSWRPEKATADPSGEKAGMPAPSKPGKGIFSKDLLSRSKRWRKSSWFFFPKKARRRPSGERARTLDRSAKFPNSTVSMRVSVDISRRARPEARSLSMSSGG